MVIVYLNTFAIISSAVILKEAEASYWDSNLLHLNDAYDTNINKSDLKFECIQLKFSLRRG